MNAIIDGLEAFKSLFSSEDDLLKHIVSHTLFFEKNVVRQQAINIRTAIRLGKAVPVRYTSNGAFFLQHKVKTTTPNFKGRKEAIQFTNNEENALFHKETKIRICFDRDGNYYPKQIIFDSTGYKVSCGVQSDIVKSLIKAVSIELYNPNRIMDWNQDVIPDEYIPEKEYISEARKLIRENKINFLANNQKQ